MTIFTSQVWCCMSVNSALRRQSGGQPQLRHDFKASLG